MADHSHAEQLMRYSNKFSTLQIKVFRLTTGGATSNAAVGVFTDGASTPLYTMTPEQFRNAVASLEPEARARILARSDSVAKSVAAGTWVDAPTKATPPPEAINAAKAALDNALPDMPIATRAALENTPSNQAARQAMIEAMAANPALTKALNAAGTEKDVVAALANIRNAIPADRRPDIPGLQPTLSTADIVNRANATLGADLTESERSALVTALDRPENQALRTRLRDATDRQSAAAILLDRTFLRTVDQGARESIRTKVAARSASLDAPNTGMSLAFADVPVAPFVQEGGASQSVGGATSGPAQSGSVRV